MEEDNNALVAAAIAVFLGIGGAVAAVVIVLFTVIFEEGLHRVEHTLIGYPLYQSMLETIIKELMILGLISFSLFMLEQFHVLDTSKDSHVRWVVGFEFSHIMIFYMAFGFILKSAMVIRVCSFSSRQWSRLHYETFEQTFDKFVDDSKEEIRKEPLCARLAEHGIDSRPISGSNLVRQPAFERLPRARVEGPLPRKSRRGHGYERARARRWGGAGVMAAADGGAQQLRGSRQRSSSLPPSARRSTSLRADACSSRSRAVSRSRVASSCSRFTIPENRPSTG